MVSVVIFWVLLLLAFVAALVPDSFSPYIGRGRWIITLILIAILGWHVFGAPK
jgi:hypothetical protein